MGVTKNRFTAKLQKEMNSSPRTNWPQKLLHGMDFINPQARKALRFIAVSEKIRAAISLSRRAWREDATEHPRACLVDSDESGVSECRTQGACRARPPLEILAQWIRGGQRGTWYKHTPWVSPSKWRAMGRREMSSEFSILKNVNQIDSPSKPSSLSDQACPSLNSRLEVFHVNGCLVVTIGQALVASAHKTSSHSSLT